MRSVFLKHQYIYYWRMWALYILINCQRDNNEPTVLAEVDAETQTASLFDPMAETAIIAFREEGTQVNLFNKDIALGNGMTNSLFDRWVKVAEGYRCQRDVLHKNLEEIKARAKALESMVEKQDKKYESYSYIGAGSSESCSFQLHP